MAEPAADGTRGRVLFGLRTLVAAGIVGFAVLAGAGALPRVMRRPAPALQKLAVVERIVPEDACREFRKLSLNVRYAAFAAGVLVVCLALAQCSAVLERIGPAGLVSVLGPVLFTVSLPVLGLFAVRLRVWMFATAGRLDWMMNGIALAVGLLAAVALQQLRRR